MSKVKERVLYEETFKKGQAKIRKDLLPANLPYFTPGTILVSMELRRAGRVEIDGEVYEFQDVHVVTKTEES